ncbi:hypothetical protein [uncultured Maribacter sp.]|uniref:hypothetical protein n=1 Tax=uncultured Maribacter sp. TaxID=431308 RepID=UPI0030D9648E|tara:strand:- start:173 stop:403 length:231 start_codon:yes stop_codon:yes gene_type:complete
MKSQHKVFVFNFLGFATLFVVFRFGLSLFLQLDSIYMSLIAAIAASFLAPKFAVIKKEGIEKIVMKWIFLKGFKEL